MKFCPECGSKREDKDVCACGYNFITGEVPEKYNEAPTYPNIVLMNSLFTHLGEVKLDELKRRKLDVGELLSYGYVTSGGMMGSYYRVDLSFETNELTVNNREWHHGPETKKVYKVDVDKVNELKNKIIDNNVCAWAELPINNSMIAYDAPTSALSLRYEEQSFGISSMVCMTDEEFKIFSELRDSLALLQIDDNLISDEVIKEGQDMMFIPFEAAAQPAPTGRQCKACGAILPDDKNICQSCGTKN